MSSKKIAFLYIIFDIIEIANVILLYIILFNSYIDDSKPSFKEILDKRILLNFSLSEEKCKNSSYFFYEWNGRKGNIPYNTTCWDSYDKEYYPCVKKEYKILSERQNIKKIYNYYFCYSNYYTYGSLLENNIIKNNESCPNHFKDCGIIDTLNQKLCLDKSMECPLTDLIILDYNDLNYNFYYNSNNYIKYNNEFLGNKTIFVSNKNNSEGIIGNLILSDNIPCINEKEKNWKSFDKYEIPSEECKTEINGKKNDERYKKIGNITYNQIYKDNLNNSDYEIMKQYLSNSDILGLYKRINIGINKKCLDNNYLIKFQNCLSIIFVKILVLLILIFFIVSGKTLIFWIFVCILKCKNPYNDEEYSLPLKIENLITAVFNLLFIVLIFPSFIEIQKFKDDFLCSDELSNKLIYKKNIDYYRVNDKLKSIIKINLILNGIIVLIFIVLFIYWMLDKSKKNEKENENEKETNELSETENENKYTFFPETPTPKF